MCTFKSQDHADLSDTPPYSGSSGSGRSPSTQSAPMCSRRKIPPIRCTRRVPSVTPERYLRNFSKRYGIEHLHPHKLRHTFASVAITNGADIASISEILGHCDKSVTLRMYTHADKESMKRAGNVFLSALKRSAAGGGA